MRVNPNPLPDLLAALNQTQLDAQEASLQIATGRSVNEPSDNQPPPRFSSSITIRQLSMPDICRVLPLSKASCLPPTQL
jgi:hypothetical protein